MQRLLSSPAPTARIAIPTIETSLAAAGENRLGVGAPTPAAIAYRPSRSASSGRCAFAAATILGVKASTDAATASLSGIARRSAHSYLLDVAKALTACAPRLAAVPAQAGPPVHTYRANAPPTGVVTINTGDPHRARPSGMSPPSPNTTGASAATAASGFVAITTQAAQTAGAATGATLPAGGCEVQRASQNRIAPHDQTDRAYAAEAAGDRVAALDDQVAEHHELPRPVGPDGAGANLRTTPGKACPGTASIERKRTGVRIQHYGVSHSRRGDNQQNRRHADSQRTGLGLEQLIHHLFSF